MVDCADPILTALRPSIDQGLITPAEVRELVTEMAEIRAASKSISEYRREAFKKLAQFRIDNSIRKLKRIHDIKASRQAQEFMTQENLLYNEREAFDSLTLGGTAGQTKGGNFGPEIEARSFTDANAQRLIQDLEKIGVLDNMKKGTIDREVMIALHEMGPNGNKEILESVGPTSRKIAEKIHDLNKRIHTNMVEAGFHVGEIDNFVIKQMYDPERVTKLGKDNFVEFMLDKLDHNTTFKKMGGESAPAKSKLEFLEQVYEDITEGKFQLAEGADSTDRIIRTFDTNNPGANLGKSRKLHYKSGEAIYEVNQEIGRKNLLDSTLSSLGRSSEHAALVRRFGSNPEKGMRDAWTRLKGFYKNLSDQGDVKAKETLERMNKRGDEFLRGRWLQISGATSMPGKSIGAQIVRAYRLFTPTRFLGSSIFASATDIPLSAMAIKSVQTGKSLTGSTFDILSRLMEDIPPSERNAAAGQLGILVDDIHALSKLNESRLDGPGKMANFARMYFKLSLLPEFTNRMRVAVSKQFAMVGHQNAKFKWDVLDPRYKISLERYGINKEMWDVMRKSSEEFNAGHKGITPESILTVPDSEVNKILSKTNIGMSAGEFKRNASLRYTTYLNDHANIGSPVPGARVDNLLKMGTLADHPLGMLVRMAGMFKSFPLQMHHILSRHALSKPGANAMSLTQAVKTNQGDWFAIAQLMASTTAFGILGMQAREMASGRSLSPESFENPEFWAEAMVRSGALGLYADALWGQYHKSHRSVLGMAAGPIGSDINSIGEIWSGLLDPDFDVSSKVFHFSKSLVPGGNLFWAKYFLDYGVFYNIQEAVNPGALGRYQERIEDKGGIVFGEQFGPLNDL